MQIREYQTDVTENISDLKGRPWRTKLRRMLFSKIRKFHNSHFHLVALFWYKMGIKKSPYLICPTDRDRRDSPMTRYLVVYLVTSY